MTPRRLAICYAAPGLHLRASSGPTRNLLSLAEALAEWADVTVAFRTLLDPVESLRVRALALDPSAPSGGDLGDDNAMRGLRPVAHLAYCRRLRAFARAAADSFDVVLEKGWRLSGWLAAAATRAGVPGLVVENDVRLWTAPVRGLGDAARMAAHHAAEALAASRCRRVPCVIAETDEMKSRLIQLRGLAPERVEVVGLGVDHARFRPLDEAGARAALGVGADALVLLYVGAMDEYHDLSPLIAALGRVRPERVELHVVGDGEYRARCEREAAAAGARVRFHGRVGHAEVPRYIAAADLCVAPYRAQAFHGGEITFSTLKIPEYLACGRPVLSVPSPAIAGYVVEGRTGFLRPNDETAWREFLAQAPARAALAALRPAAADAVREVSWNRTARRYLEICERLTAGRQAAARTTGPRTAGPAGPAASVAAIDTGGNVDQERRGTACR
ncbi:MAG: glycosyltransferase family 4 protein [Vicinamibacterales bacterium]